MNKELSIPCVLGLFSMFQLGITSVFSYISHVYDLSHYNFSSYHVLENYLLCKITLQII